MRRYAAGKDTAHTPIVDGLRAMGCSVLVLNVKDGPDLAVGHRGATYLLEVKTPPQVVTRKGRGKRAGQEVRELRPATPLSEGQRKWHDAWRGRARIVYDLQDALQAVGFQVAPSYTPSTLACEDSDCHRPAEAGASFTGHTCPFHRRSL